jgi:hypothetical protein
MLWPPHLLHFIRRTNDWTAKWPTGNVKEQIANIAIMSRRKCIEDSTSIPIKSTTDYERGN